MKTRLFRMIIPALLLIASCDDDHGRVPYDDTPPFPPVGIVSTSLDNAVRLDWIENQEPDLAGYNIYVSSSYNGRYTCIGTSRTASFVDGGAKNGVTYYYAVSAFDYSGNESELSREVVYDTPRPEGRGVVLTNRFIDPYRAGYDFSAYRIVHYDTDEADIYLEMNGSAIPFFVVWQDTDIQDMGYTRDIDEISKAPEDGWSPTKDAVAIKGHTYVVWTHDNHFAKIRVTDVRQNTVTFDWAFQTALGNPELFTRERPGFAKNAGMPARRRH
ncbi:MAG: hypothetical protein QHI48_07835 [Bacteroidota bacterium]|nr:hypothetical protein [Bacteroidota bacterium]